MVGRLRPTGCVASARSAALGVALATLFAAGSAGAALENDSALLAQAWRSAGARVVVDKPRFLVEDDTTSVVLPAMPPAECTSVVFLAPRGLGFHARIVAPPGTNEGGKIQSEAGAIAIEHCGEGTPTRVLLGADSGRGAVETVVARSSQPLAPLRAVLPERGGSATAPGPEPGPLPLLPPQATRAEIAESRARLDGARVEPRETWQAGLDGTGSLHRVLLAGCHRLRLLSLDARTGGELAGRGRVDLDAEMRNADDDHLLARDRSDAPDADLAVCLGEAAEVEVVFAGSPADAPVLVTHSWWPLPERLPTLWGPEATARMAHALLARHVETLAEPPSVVLQGGSGTTSPIPIVLQPGACYVAVLALAQGTARATALRIHVGAQDYLDDRGGDDNAAVVSFCAVQYGHASARVEIHGPPPVAWGLAVIPVAHDIWSRTR